MRPPPGKSFLPWLCGALLTIALLIGCQSTAPFPRPDSTWQTRIGQLQYATARRSVIGECIVSRGSARDFQLDFHTGPGFALLRLWRSGDHVRAEGVLARGSWEGNANRAPQHLAGWVKMAGDFPRNAGRQTSLSSPKTGERFVFVFAE
jgi:hypothetical protein